jgi:hypothetical protein
MRGRIKRSQVLGAISLEVISLMPRQVHRVNIITPTWLGAPRTCLALVCTRTYHHRIMVGGEVEDNQEAGEVGLLLELGVMPRFTGNW